MTRVWSWHTEAGVPREIRDGVNFLAFPVVDIEPRKLRESEWLGIWSYEYFPWARGMVWERWGKVLCECEDLSSNPQNSHKTYSCSNHVGILAHQREHERRGRRVPRGSWSSYHDICSRETKHSKRPYLKQGRWGPLCPHHWPPYVYHGTCLSTFTAPSPHTNKSIAL